MSGREDVVLNETEAQIALLDVRDRARKIRDAWRNPQYGTNVEAEVQALLDSFDRLDDSLSDGNPPPTDWR